MVVAHLPSRRWQLSNHQHLLELLTAARARLLIDLLVLLSLLPAIFFVRMIIAIVILCVQFILSNLVA